MSIHFNKKIVNSIKIFKSLNNIKIESLLYIFLYLYKSIHFMMLLYYIIYLINTNNFITTLNINQYLLFLHD